MNKIAILIISCILFSTSFAFARGEITPASEKLDLAKKDLLSCHIDFAKASIDSKCEKLKKKIKKAEGHLRHLEIYSDQIDSVEADKQRTKWLKKIQKYEDRIYNFKLLKSSAEIIDFTNL